MTPDVSSEPEQPASGLIGDLLSGLSRLVRGEIDLARAEAKRSLQDATGALVASVVAVILAITALNVLSGAAVAGLVALGLSTFWAGVSVGLVLLVVAVGLLQLARHKISPSNLAPKRTVTNLRRDAETFKSMVRPRATSDIHS
jgi:uncharacterized membrane protein YgcG